MKHLVIPALTLMATSTVWASSELNTIKDEKSNVFPSSLNINKSIVKVSVDTQQRSPNIAKPTYMLNSNVAPDTDVSSFFSKDKELRKSKWQYRTTYDEVEQESTTLSLIKSTNTINMGVTQGGNQNLYIAIHNVHDTGFYNDKLEIGYEKGLIEVCLDSCWLRARFDDDDARWYKLGYLNPHTYTVSSETNYVDTKNYGATTLKDNDYFLLKLYNSKQLILKIPSFDGNSYTYKFNTQGLNELGMGAK